MAQNYYWSPSTVSFYPVAIKQAYIAAGSFPDDAVPIDDSCFESYAATPAPVGKKRGVGPDTMPVWIDA